MNRETAPPGTPLSQVGGLPKARYEAAIWTTGGQRSFLFGANQDARFDADQASQRELMRKARYFEKNNAFVNRLADIFEQYTVGSGGLQVVSKSPDATAYFNLWAQDCDADGLMDFGLMQSVAARAWFIDGESFLIRTNYKGRLKIQMIESHRVATPPGRAQDEGKSVIQGRELVAGRPIGLWVNEGPSPGVSDQWRLIPEEDVIQISEPTRAAMYRGLTFLYPVMNDLHDLDDLQMLVLQVAKQAACVGNVTLNKTGELDSMTARRAAMKINSQNAAGVGTIKNSSEFYQVKLGAQEIAMQIGDSINQFQANRPSLAEREHWEYLLSKICAGVGISKLLILPTSMQGTVTRADLDIAAAFFRTRSAIPQSAVRKVFYWVMDWAQKFDREVLRGGFNFSDYQNVIVRSPRSPNVDVGRNSKALIAELNSKVRTYQDVYAESGQDWREQFAQCAAEKEMMEKLNIVPIDLVPKQDAVENTSDE